MSKKASSARIGAFVLGAVALVIVVIGYRDDRNKAPAILV